MKMISLFCGQKMRWYKEVCEANQELQSLNSSFQVRTCKVTTILTSGFEHGSISLASLHEVIESLLGMYQEVVKVILECEEEIQKDEQLFSLVRQFFKMSLPMLELYTDFMKFLKGRVDSWLIVRVAMQQIEAKRRAGILNYRETRQQLIDLEAAMVPLSADFDTLFHSFSDGRATMLWDYADQIMCNTKLTSVKACKVSHVTTAATLSTVLISAVAALRSALPPKRRGIDKFVHGMRTLFDEWLAKYEYGSWDKGYEKLDECKLRTEDIYRSLMGHRIIDLMNKKRGDQEIRDQDYERYWKSRNYFKSYQQGLKVTDFDGIANLLEELKSKMNWVLQFSDFVNKQDEEEIVILMDEIKTRISGLTNTIEDMSMHAYKCISYIRQASVKVLQSN